MVVGFVDVAVDCGGGSGGGGVAVVVAAFGRCVDVVVVAAAVDAVGCLAMEEEEATAHQQLRLAVLHRYEHGRRRMWLR